MTITQGHTPETVRLSFALSCRPELGQVTTLGCHTDCEISGFVLRVQEPSPNPENPVTAGGLRTAASEGDLRRNPQS